MAISINIFYHLLFLFECAGYLPECFLFQVPIICFQHFCICASLFLGDFSSVQLECLSAARIEYVFTRFEASIPFPYPFGLSDFVSREKKRSGKITREKETQSPVQFSSFSFSSSRPVSFPLRVSDSPLSFLFAVIFSFPSFPLPLCPFSISSRCIEMTSGIPTVQRNGREATETDTQSGPFC